MASKNILEKKTAKNTASERFMSLANEDVERFVEAEDNKNTQGNIALNTRREIPYLRAPMCYCLFVCRFQIPPL